MSRTVRRKQGLGWLYGIESYRDVLKEWIWDKEYSCGLVINYDPKSKEGKKRIALFHADNNWYSGWGPSWWRRQFYQRPYRQMAKREIQRSLMNDEYDAIIPDRPKLGYWD